jgi:uncharacterized membrane protein
MTVSKLAISGFTGGQYNVTAYPITNSCTAANPCKATFNDFSNISPSAIPFTVSGKQVFTIDFSQNPIRINNVANSGFSATSSGGAITIDPAPALTFNNSTPYTINIANTTGSSFVQSSLTGGLTCGASGCQIAASSSAATGTINGTTMPQTLTFNGVNKSGGQIFTFTATFDGSSHTLNLPYMTVTASGTAPFYRVSVQPQTLSFVSTTSNEIDMTVSKLAISGFTGGQYNGTAYPITNSCTAANPCKATFNDFSNISPSAIPFTVSGKQVFTIDFSQNPPAVANLLPGSGYGVYPQLVNGVYQIVMSKTTTVNLSLTGSVSPMIQQKVGPNTYNSFISNDNTINFTFFLPISQTNQNNFIRSIWGRMKSEIIFSSSSNGQFADIKTLLSSTPVNRTGTTLLTIDPTSTFWSQAIGSQSSNSSLNLNIQNGGPPTSPYPTIQLTTNNIKIQSFKNQSFKLDSNAAANLIITGVGGLSYTFPCQSSGGQGIPACSLSIFPLYAFTDKANSSGSIGQSGANTFSFAFAIPSNSLVGMSKIGTGSKITIIDGNQSIVFNMAGSISKISLAGTYYGQTITSGSVQISSAGTMTITGSVASASSMTFSYNPSVTATGTIYFE